MHFLARICKCKVPDHIVACWLCYIAVHLQPDIFLLEHLNIVLSVQLNIAVHLQLNIAACFLFYIVVHWLYYKLYYIQVPRNIDLYPRNYQLEDCYRYFVYSRLLNKHNNLFIN